MTGATRTAFTAALTACAAAALVLTAPAAAQTDNAAVLAQIDASLPGTLINDPTSLDWRVQGARLRVSSVVDAAIPGGGAAVQYEVRRAGANPWDMQAYIPLTADISEGEVVTFGFWARTLSSDSEGGQGRVSVRVQRDAAPWPGFGDTAFAIGPDWRWYEASATATVAIPRREAFLALQLAGAAQVVEIGQAFVVSGADRILGNGARPVPPLPPQMQGHGTLISQPAVDAFIPVGPAGSHALRDEPAIWQARAMQVTVPAASAQPWDIQAQVPLTEGIAAGEAIEIGVAARTVSAATEDGRARVGLRLQQASAPYDGFGDAVLTIGPNWQLLRVRTTATADLAAGNGVVALHFAGAQQVVDLGPVYVVRLAPGQ